MYFSTTSKVFIFYLFWAVFHISVVTNDRVNFLTEEVRSLSELPMERLIQLRTIMVEDDEKSMAPQGRGRSTALVLPVALPLKRMSNRKSIRRYEDDWDDKGYETKVSKVSKIFQLTMTTLSFLAFGGYLVTLIVSAIQNSRNAGTPSGVIVFSDPQSLQNYNRPKRRAWITNPMENELDEDRIYQGMIILSQCYVDAQ